MITWLASYPRSGNTFVRSILHKNFGFSTYSLYNDREIENSTDFRDLVGQKIIDFTEINAIERLRSDSCLHFIKTHEPVTDYTAYSDNVIYILRDGLDATSSYHHYLNNLSCKSTSYEDIILGNTRWQSTWSDHYTAWKNVKCNDYLLLNYDDLVNDSISEIERISRFLQIGSLSNEVVDFSECNSINPVFFRKGMIGSYQNDMPLVAQLLFYIVNIKTYTSLGYSIPSSLKQYFSSSDGLDSFLYSFGFSIIKQNLEKRQKLNIFQSKVKEMSNRISSTDYDKRISSLEQKLTDKAQECEKATDLVHHLSERICDLDSTVASQKLQISDANNQFAVVSELNNSLAEAQKYHESVINTLHKELFESQLARLVDKQEKLDMIFELEKLRNSHSWRITKPLREVLKHIRS